MTLEMTWFLRFFERQMNPISYNFPPVNKMVLKQSSFPAQAA